MWGALSIAGWSSGCVPDMCVTQQVSTMLDERGQLAYWGLGQPQLMPARSRLYGLWSHLLWYTVRITGGNLDELGFRLNRAKLTE